MSATIAGIVLAGGQGRRMGGEPKVLRELDGVSLLARVLQRAAPQVGCLVVSSDNQAVRSAVAPYRVLADALPGFAGPLSGILAGLEFARERLPGCEWLVSIAADTPWFPPDLVAQLLGQALPARAEVAVAGSGGVVHPVFALWSVALAARLREALVVGEVRSVQRFQASCRRVQVDWPATPYDPFFNINTRQDLDAARRLCIARQ